MLRNVFLSVAEFAKSSRFPDYFLRYNPMYYREASAAFGITTRSSDPAHSDHLLARSMSWARRTTYGNGFGEVLADWPVLTKKALRESPDDFRRLRAFSVPASTSGSTGQPISLWRSFENVAAEQAFLDSLLTPTCPPMGSARVAVLRADHVKRPDDHSEPFGVYRNAGRRLVLSNPHLSATTVAWYHEALVKFRPDVLWVYPSALASLLHFLAGADLRLKIPTILSSSEVMSVNLWNSAANQLGSRVIDYYGQGERVCAAYSEAPGQYRFHTAYGKVELIPGMSAVSTAGTLPAKIVATSFWNSAMPLVRYDTGDFAILPGDCDDGHRKAIENGDEPFQGIMGRQSDYIVSSGGARITGLNHIPRNTASVLQTQIVQQSPDRIEIRALCDGALSDSDKRALIANARAMLPTEIDVEVVESRALIQLPNGKTPFVVRCD